MSFLCNGCDQFNSTSNQIQERHLLHTPTDFENAWVKGDTVFVLNFIDSLSSKDTLDFLSSVYHFSEVTGFGVALIDVYDTSYYLPNKRNQILRKNVLGLINAYKKSEYFFRQPCETILVHQYHDIFNPKLNKDSYSQLINKMFKDVDCYVHWSVEQ